MDYAEQDTGGGWAEGEPCWVDAMLPDVEGGKRFYGELFGWTFAAGAAGATAAAGPEYGQYTQAYSDGLPVAALAPKADGRMPTVWTVYLATPDAAALAGRVRRAGGSMVREPRPVGPLGTVGLAADPEGAVFGIRQGGAHHGFAKQRQPGSYCWTEVYSRDKDRVDPFYEGVFRYGGFDLDLDGAPFRTWSPPGAPAGPETAIGGRSLMSPATDGYSTPETPPHFLVYFNVVDADATAAAVTRLGGRVQLPPRDIPYGRIAVLRDNQGATFAVLQD
ncbi:VOC family protein [Streptomyces sp. G44]|uniref:VOC family protein n=1 Tax=Streptomyces sp. G44 TaxID=2807632 RepID=UPI0019606BEF|nr:VOC family protein [Streptomyces sp. G44]MBM7173719.1 VOC family protein [Streptomyces sp. G44]